MAELHSLRTIANVSPLPSDPQFQRLWSQLEDKLLALGGRQIVWRGSEVHLAELVSRGQLFAQPVRRRRGQQSGCHRNVARLWAKNVASTQIVTGYALSSDGLWRQHSWALKGGQLIETTLKRQRYFGIVLDKFEALGFCLANYLSVEYLDGKLPPDAKSRYAGLRELHEFLERKGAVVSRKSECPGCHVHVGELHKSGCDVEPCPYCGGQLLSCEDHCLGTQASPPQDDRLAWTGLWPGAKECQEFGWFAKLMPGEGRVPCASDDPGATEDLNRLRIEGRWDRSEKRWVKVGTE